MATNTATKNGDWSDTSVWDLGHVPIAGEDVELGSYTVAIDVIRVPATSGTLASLSTGAGQATLALQTVGSTEIYATTITGSGNANGNIYVTGTTSNTCLIAGNISGGGSYSYRGVRYASNGALTVIGNITGGAGSTAYGLYISGGVTDISIVGTVTAGDGAYGIYSSSLTGASLTIDMSGNNVVGSDAGVFSGIYHNTATTPLVIIDCNQLTGEKSFALGGYSPTTWTNTGNAYYATLAGGGTHYGPVPLDHQMLSGVVCGDVTGNRTDCPVASALDTQTYGDPDSLITGTYHEATVAEVQDGVFFGPASAYEGTYEGAGGGGGVLRRIAQQYGVG